MFQLSVQMLIITLPLFLDEYLFVLPRYICFEPFRVTSEETVMTKYVSR